MLLLKDVKIQEMSQLVNFRELAIFKEKLSESFLSLLKQVRAIRDDIVKLALLKPRSVKLFFSRGKMNA